MQPSFRNAKVGIETTGLLDQALRGRRPTTDDGLCFVDQSPGSLIGLLHPADQPMPRTSRRQTLGPRRRRPLEPKGVVGKLDDGTATIAGRGDEFRDPALDPPSALAHALSVIRLHRQVSRPRAP
jgi:hypothetical protein